MQEIKVEPYTHILAPIVCVEVKKMEAKHTFGERNKKIRLWLKHFYCGYFHVSDI